LTSHIGDEETKGVWQGFEVKVMEVAECDVWVHPRLVHYFCWSIKTVWQVNCLLRSQVVQGPGSPLRLACPNPYL